MGQIGGAAQAVSSARGWPVAALHAARFASPLSSQLVMSCVKGKSHISRPSSANQRDHHEAVLLYGPITGESTLQSFATGTAPPLGADRPRFNKSG